MLRACTRRFFSQLIFPHKSKLKSYDMETLIFSLEVSNEYGAKSVQNIKFPRAGTLADLQKVLEEKFNLTDIMFMCNIKIPLHDATPSEILLNRYFYLFSKQTNIMIVEGQLFDQNSEEPVIEGLTTLELPATTKQEMEKYFRRVNQWVVYKTGKNVTDPDLKITCSEAANVFLQAVIDPTPQNRNIIQQQILWRQWYWKVQNLKQKKRQADQLCLKKVKRFMSMGLGLLAANISFIWSGTYIFFSWDIIEPIAYFISSLGGIIVASRFFRLGRPYSNSAYQQYLHKRWAPEFYKQVGFSQQQLLQAQIQLLQLQSIIKDHLLKKL